MKTLFYWLRLNSKQALKKEEVQVLILALTFMAFLIGSLFLL